MIWHIMVELIPNVHLVDGSVGCNTYLITGEEGITLIDTGLRGNESIIYANLNRIGRSPEDIKKIVITHAHLDHINCLYRLKKDSGAIVMVGERDAPIISGEQPLPAMDGPIGAISGVLRSYYRYRPVQVDVMLKDGDTIEALGGLKVIETPGHSTGNIGLYSSDRKLLFSSDTIRVMEGKLVMPNPRFTGDIQATVGSIRKISNLDFDIMLPGHGSPVMTGASEKVRKLYREINQ